MEQLDKINESLVFKNENWEIYLNPDQYYLGRCVVVLKSDAHSLSDLTNEQWLDFAKLVKKLETGLIKSFGATMFNWTCLMNDAYKNDPPSPKVHWHVRPRYKSVVNFQGLEFKDDEFGSHYARGTNRLLTDGVLKEVVEKLKSLI